MASQEFFSSNPEVCGGVVCATGTRVPITVILDSLTEGATEEEILASYPSLRLEHIKAALDYVAEYCDDARPLQFGA